MFKKIYLCYQDLRAVEIESLAKMEEDMKLAQEEIIRKKRDVELAADAQKKKMKIATPGVRSEPGTPRTPARSRFGF